MSDGPKVLATTVISPFQALLFRQLSDRVVYLQHASPPLPDDKADEFAALGIEVVPGCVARLVINNDRLSAAMTEDGQEIALDTLAVASRVRADSAVLDALGLAAQPLAVGADVGTIFEAGPSGETAVAGVWIAGNVTDAHGTVVSSAAAGLSAGAAINADLIEEDVRAAVKDRQHQR